MTESGQHVDVPAYYSDPDAKERIPGLKTA